MTIRSKWPRLAALMCVFAAAGVFAQSVEGLSSKGDSNTTTSAIIQGAKFDALPDVLATYDGGKFTKEELSSTLKLRKPYSVQHLAPGEVITLAPDKLRQVVSDYVFERLLVEKALSEGIDKSSTGVRERLERYEDEVFNRLYYERVFSPELDAVREKMLREAYERDKATKYTLAGFTKLAEIFFNAYRPYEVKPGETIFSIAERECGDRTAASRILRDEPFHYPRRSPGVEKGEVDFREVKPGEKLLIPLRHEEITSKETLAKKLRHDPRIASDFLELAQQYSEVPPSRRTELFELDSFMDPIIKNAVEKTATTSVTDVLRTSHGIHIIKVMDRADTRTLSFEEVRNRIQLDPQEVSKAEETARRNLVERLRSKYRLELNDEALKLDDYQYTTNPLTASTWLARSADFVYTLDDFRRELLPFQKSWRGLTYQERVDFIKASPKILKHLVKLESKSLGLQNDPQYKAEMESKAVIDVSAAYLRSLEEKMPPITEAEMREWYDKHIDQFTGTPKVKLREITKRVNLLLPEPEKTRLLNEAKQKLQSIRQKIKTVGDFEEMARRESDAIGTRSRGGLIGVVPLAFRGEAFQAQIEKLAPGQVSEPFLYGSEMMIVMVEQKVAAPVVPFEEAKSRIERGIREERRESMWKELREKLFAEKHVQLHI
ncbi:MAG: peptidylprolyl isomerase [Candidatus Sumerlaeaceae bacterium]|nr:peptidylprolyl isomerase [Candidatus Sumerlaeaceae bacterium]